MDTKQIKAELTEKDCSFSILAKVLGVTYHAIYGVCERTVRSTAIANHICQIIGKPPEKVFPDVKQYHTNYNPKADEAAKVELWRERLSA